MTQHFRANLCVSHAFQCVRRRFWPPCLGRSDKRCVWTPGLAVSTQKKLPEESWAAAHGGAMGGPVTRTPPCHTPDSSGGVMGTISPFSMGMSDLSPGTCIFSNFLGKMLPVARFKGHIVRPEMGGRLQAPVTWARCSHQLVTMPSSIINGSSGLMQLDKQNYLCDACPVPLVHCQDECND